MAYPHFMSGRALLTFHIGTTSHDVLPPERRGPSSLLDACTRDFFPRIELGARPQAEGQTDRSGWCKRRQSRRRGLDSLLLTFKQNVQG